MRKLITHDIFTALKFVKRVGVKDEVVRLADTLRNNGTSDLTQTEAGIQLLLGSLANCGDEAAEAAFYEFLSGPTETTAEELKEMDLEKFAELVKEFVSTIDFDTWKAFFTSLAAVTKRSSST